MWVVTPDKPPPRTPAPSRERRGLTRSQIVMAAIELLDEVGIAEVSTRRLAAKLGISSPTLYWHVRGKGELLDLIADELCAAAFDIDPTAPWRKQLETGLRQFRHLVLAHRDVAPLLRERPATGPNRLRQIETTLQILLAAGISTDDAAGISRLLVAHALTSPPTRPLDATEHGDAAGPLSAYPSLGQVLPAFARLSDDDLFELGVEIILDGIERRVSAPAAQISPPRPK